MLKAYLSGWEPKVSKSFMSACFFLNCLVFSFDNLISTLLYNIMLTNAQYLNKILIFYFTNSKIIMID